MQTLLWIKPKGKFWYSPDSGFYGEADYVKVVQSKQSKKQQQLSQKNEALSSQKKTQTTALKQDHSLVTKSTLKESHSVKWYYIIGIILIIAGMIYRLIKSKIPMRLFK